MPSTDLPSTTPDSTAGELLRLRQPCTAPAPLVVNGLPFAGCSLEVDHDGPHEFTIRWAR